MRLPPSPAPLAPVYLNLLQARATRLPQAVVPADPASRPAERIAPPAGARLPRGSLVDIKA